MGINSYKRGDLGRRFIFLQRSSNSRSILSIKPHYQIGVIQSKMGDKELAISSYQEALKVNPKFYKGYLALGLAKK